jgi:hypothetical protein
MLERLSRHVGPACGRFDSRQLNRELSNPPERQPWWPGRWRYLLAGLLFSSEVSAQQQPAAPPISQYDRASRVATNSSTNVNSIEGPTAAATDTIRGQVIGVNDKLPIPFATIKYTAHNGVAVDADGNFFLLRKWLGNNTILVISAIGYQPLEVDLQKSDVALTGQKLLVAMLTQQTTGMVEVTVVKKPKRVVQIIRDTLAAVGFVEKTLTVYPNPVNRGGSVTIGIRLDSPDTYTVQLYSLTGTLVAAMEVAGNQGSKDVLMNIPPTATPGNYFLRLSRRRGNNVQTRQLVIL